MLLFKDIFSGMYKKNISSVDLKSFVAYFGLFVFISDFCFAGDELCSDTYKIVKLFEGCVYEIEGKVSKCGCIFD